MLQDVENLYQRINGILSQLEKDILISLWLNSISFLTCASFT